MKRWLIILCCLFPFVGKGQIITTVAGNGMLGFSGDGVPATAAKLHLPGKAIFDENGNMFIADSWAHRIRKVDRLTGIISTVAGTGVAGYNGDNIPATSAQLYDPVGLAMDSTGNLYIGDAINERVRKIDLTTGIITTFAGNGVGAGTGWGGFSGDGGLATNASLNAPAYITIDRKGNLYIEDGKNYRVRKVNLSSCIITTVAGNGNWGYSGDGGNATAAEFNFIQGIGVDRTGNLFICDTNSTIRRVDLATGIITTVAGVGLSGYTGDGTPATSSKILNPFDVTVDDNGNYYIAEFKGRIRKVDTFGIIQTFAGTSSYGYNGDGIPATSSLLNETTGVSTDNCGNLYIADASNNRIRKVDLNPNCWPAGVENVISNKISTYPNPTNDILHIDGWATKCFYQVLNIVGVMTQQGTLKEGHNNISLRSLPAGLYLLEVISDDGSRVVKRVLKE